MEQSVADRDNGEELIDTKVGGVHSTAPMSLPDMLLVYDMGISMLNML